MKKILILFFALFGISLANASMKQIQTEHFDIIYSDDIELAARVLYENVEEQAQNVAKKLGKKVEGKKPIYLVSNSQTLNGYYAGNIVIQVAPAASGSLENLENTLLRVFTHEYTHALTVGFSFVLIPNNILFPNSFKEGVAVAYESAFNGKYGRLYDPLVWHPIIQNKLDDRFPSLTQSGLARDMYPEGSWVYYYGAAFAKYLLETYGDEKYNKLWEADWRLFTKHKFFNIYEVALDDVWNNFVDSVKVPTNVKQPKILSESLPKSGYSFPVVANSDLYFYDFNDKYVYKFDGKASADALFFAGDSLNSLGISDDGKYLLVSKSQSKLNSTKMPIGEYKVELYSLEDNSFLNEEYKFIREADFVTNQKIIAVKVGKNASTNLVLIDRNSKRELTLFEAGMDRNYSAIYQPTYLGDNKVAFIAANGLNRDILVIDIQTQALSKMNLSSSIKAVRYLQATQTKNARFLTFAWADLDKNMLYRSAKLNLKTQKLEIQNVDVSGGSFQPVIYKGEVLGVAKYDTYNRFSIIPNEYFSVSSQNLVAYTNSNRPKNIFKKQIPNASDYNAFGTSYFWGKPGIGLALEIPNRILELGAFGVGVSLNIQDPTEFAYGKLETLFYIHPFFLQLKGKLGIRDAGFDFSVEGHELLRGYNSARVRKTGLGLNLTYDLPLSHSGQNLSFAYDFVVDWTHKVYEYANTQFSPKKIFWQKSVNKILSAYKKKYTDNLIIHSLGLKFDDVRSNEVARSMFFAKDISKISYGAKIGHSYHINQKQNAGYFLNRLEGITPVAPIKLGLSGFVGYNAYLQAGSGSVYYFNQDWLVDDKTSGYVKGIFGYKIKPDKAKEIEASKVTGALGYDINVTIFDVEIQDTLSWLPIMFNRFKIDVEYDGVLQFYTKSDKLATHYSDSISTALLLDFSGTELGVRFGTPLSVKPEFSFGLSFATAF